MVNSPFNYSKDLRRLYCFPVGPSDYPQISCGIKLFDNLMWRESVSSHGVLDLFVLVTSPRNWTNPLTGGVFFYDLINYVEVVQQLSWRLLRLDWVFRVTWCLTETREVFRSSVFHYRSFVIVDLKFYTNGGGRI